MIIANGDLIKLKRQYINGEWNIHPHLDGEIVKVLAINYYTADPVFAKTAPHAICLAALKAIK